jgi:hypothetical protein
MGVLDWFTENFVDKSDPLYNAQPTPEDARRAATAGVPISAIAKLPTEVISAAQFVDQLGTGLGRYARGKILPEAEEVPFVEAFAGGRYRPGGYKEVQEDLQRKVDEFRAANPNATPEEITAAGKRYETSPEHIAFQRERYPVQAYGINEQIADRIDRLMGVPSDTLKTNEEMALQAGTQAATPLGLAKTIGKLPLAARAIAGFLAPGSEAKTAAGLATSGGVAGSLVEGVQHLLGRDVKPEEYTQAEADIEAKKQAALEALNREPPSPPAVHLPEINQAEQLPPTDVQQAHEDGEKAVSDYSSIIPAAPTLAMFGAIGASLAGIRPKIAARAAQTAPSISSGPTTIKPKIDPTVAQSINYAFDERAPITRNVYKATGDREDAYNFSREIGTNSPAAAGLSRQNYAQWGWFGDQQVVAPSTLHSVQQKLQDTGKWAETAEYLHARTELTSRKAKINNSMDEINQITADIRSKNAEMQAALQRSDRQAAAQANTDMQDLIEKQNKLYDPRLQLRDRSTQELETIVNNGVSDPLAQRYIKGFDDNVAAQPRQLVKDELMESDVVARINARHAGTYAPQQEDPLGGTRGVKRFVRSLWKSADILEDPKAGGNMRLNPFFRRSLDEDDAQQIQNLLNPHDAFLRSSSNIINWREGELYKRRIVEKMMNSPNKDEVMEFYKDKSGRTAFSEDQARVFIDRNFVTDDNYIPVRLSGNGGKVSFVKFYDSQLHTSLQAKAMSASVGATLKHMLQRGATGTFQLGFAPMSTTLENVGIQLARGRGSVGTIDYLAYRGAKALGADIPESVVSGIGTITKPLDLFVTQAETMLKSMELFWKMNRVRFADNLVKGLESDTGWAGMALKQPEFRAWAAKWAPNVIDTFQDTLEGTLFNGKGMSFNNLARNLEHTNTIIDMVDSSIPGGKYARVLGSAVAEPFAQMKLFVTAYRDSAKYLYAARNMAYQELRHGGPVPKDVVDKIVNDTRTLTGDYSKRMGSHYGRAWDDNIPYFRVLVQSTKNFAQRVTTDPRLAAAVITGLVMPKIAFELQMSSWDKEAYDWYYRQLRPGDRAAFVGFVRPDIAARKLAGEQIPFHPSYIYQLYTPQESRPLVEAVTQGFRGLGMFNEGQKDKQADTSGFMQVREALKQSLGIGVPPLLGATLAPAGVRLEPGNIFTDEKIVNPDRNEDRANKALAASSNITNGASNFVGSLFGTIGRNVMQGFASAENIYAKDSNLWDAVTGGVGEAARRTLSSKVQPAPFVSIPGFNDMVLRRYRNTGASGEYFKMREAFQASGGRGQKSFKPEDPVLAFTADELRRAGSSPEAKDYSARYKELDSELKAVENNRNIPYYQRQQMQQENLKKLQELTLEQNRWMLKQEKMIGNLMTSDGDTLKQVYKAKFGADFSLKDYAKQMKEAKSKSAQ